MALKEGILAILAGQSGPMNRVVLSKKLGEPTSNFQNQLDRMEKQGLVEKNEQKEYIITEAGRQFALAEPPPDKIPPDETPPGEETEESLKTTEYQQFVQMGKITGVVPVALIEQVATHIWRGGDYLNLDWVWKGLTEMGIRPDLARRWFHSWRSFLHQPIPSSVAEEVGGTPRTEGEKVAAKAEAVGKGKRDYMLDASGLPLYVGEGVGDLDHDEAVKLSALRQAALARGGTQAGGQPATVGTMADEMTKVFNAVTTFLGPQSKGKSYLVKPGEEGYVVEEVDEGKPTLIPTPQSNTNPSKSYLVDSEGNVTEAPAGRPIILKQTAPANPPQLGKTLVVRQTPEGVVTEEFDVGKPIILNAAPSPGSNMPPMLMPAFSADGKPMTDDKGNPIYGPAEQMMNWYEFWGNQRRADERHQSAMGLFQTIRENIPDGIQAVLATVAELKGGTGAKTPTPQEQPQQTFKCGDCGTEFNPPAGWAGQPLKCPNPECGREYTKEDLLA